MGTFEDLGTDITFARFINEGYEAEYSVGTLKAAWDSFHAEMIKLGAWERPCDISVEYANEIIDQRMAHTDKQDGMSRYNHYAAIHTVVTRALDGLGFTADEVAASLGQKGITGRRTSCDECPISNFIKSIDESYVPYIGVRQTKVSGITIWNTRPISMFVSKFDAGEYLSLIDDNED